MTWKISKSFDFCYGHRVWSQELNPEFSLDPCLKCRHLHGHQGKVILYVESNKLKNGMVTDFNHLNWFKAFLDDVLDHKFILDINDPLFSTLLPHINKSELIKFEECYYLTDLTYYITKNCPVLVYFISVCPFNKNRLRKTNNH